MLRKGQIDLDPAADGFSSRALHVSALRTAIGITRKNEILFVVTRREIRLATLAAVMKQLGAVDAMNLDGGGSTALYYRGRVLNEPVSRLSNVVIIKD